MRNLESARCPRSLPAPAPELAGKSRLLVEKSRQLVGKRRLLEGNAPLIGRGGNGGRLASAVHGRGARSVPPTSPCTRTGKPRCS